MNAEQIARLLYAKLRDHDYPYLATTIHLNGAFPRVEFWNDRAMMEEIIICYDRPQQQLSARDYALATAEEMVRSGSVCGVIASVVTTDLRVVELD